MNLEENKSINLWVLILAGGRGTRFWPLSRRSLPKQCLSLDGGPTLIQRTLRRLSSILPPSRVLVVTGPDMAAILSEQLPELPPENLLIEPSGRNTAPAIAWGTWVAGQRGAEVVAVLPSDHLIKDEAAFCAALQTAAVAAGAPGALLTLGVVPTRPETGFGWIARGAVLDDASGLSRVSRFIEKPPLLHAEQMLSGGGFFWNAGMFLWRPDSLRAAIARWLSGCEEMLAGLEQGRGIADVWSCAEATSIDYGVMERSPDVMVIPVDFGWSDVGSWSALPDVLPKHPWGVGVSAEIISSNASGNVVHAPDRIVALLDVEGLMVIDTGDVLLVGRLSAAQQVRGLLEQAVQRGLERLT